MSECNPRGAGEEPMLGTGPRTVGTFGLVTNTARGELAVVDLDLGRLVDLDPANPGYGMLPIGTFPEVIDATQDGCFAVTANRGSCDLSWIDTSRLLSPFFGQAPATRMGAEPGAAAIRAIVPRAAGRRLATAPHEITLLPPSHDPAMTCSATASYRALVTFPACDLVAVIELASGEIQSAVQMRDGQAQVLTPEQISCPSDFTAAGQGPPPGDAAASPADAAAVGPDAAATGEDTSAPLEDAGAPPDEDGGPREAGGDAGTPFTPAPRAPQLGPLALAPDGRRVFVGGAAAPYILALEFDGTALRVPAQGAFIPLHEGAIGTTKLRLTVDPWAPTAAADGRGLGVFIGGRFLYAIALDGSVRVIALAAADGTGRDFECDVNVEPSVIEARGGQCVEAGTDEARQGRRPLAIGPGMRIPVVGAPDLPPPVPRDITFASLTDGFDMVIADEVADGVFGYLLGSNGQVYLTNLLATAREGERFHGDNPVPHTFRNDSARVGTGDITTGPPRLVQSPVRTFTGVEVPFPTRVTLASRLAGPRIEARMAQNQPGDQWITFGRPSQTLPQRWTVTWEGVLPGSERRTGLLRPAGEAETGACGNGDGNGGPLSCVFDAGADFCRSGVRTGDLLALVGCTTDAECGTERGCLQITPGAPGLCVPRAQLNDEALARTCARHLASRRRYEIAGATPHGLNLRLKLDEVPRLGVAACQVDGDCLTDAARQPLPGRMDDLGFQCLEVRPGEGRRCVKACAAADGTPDDTLCRAGHVCEAVGADRPFCVEAPPPEPACWPEGTRFRVQAGRAFLVTGTATPVLPTSRVNEAGQCVPNLDRHPRVVDRISLDAPRCAGLDEETATADAMAFDPAAAGIAGNPCLFRSPNTDEPGTAPRWKALFQNHQLKLVLTNLDEYGGDGLSLTFQVTGGFRPDTIELTGNTLVALGHRILAGPNRTPESRARGGEAGTAVWWPYIFVIDQGRTQEGGRGQIHRINPRTPRFQSGRFDSLFLNQTWPIQ
jgi:hypothetical protein